MKRLILSAIVSFFALGLLFIPSVATAQVNTLDPVCQQAPQASVCNPSNNTEIVGSNGVIVKVSRLIAVITAIASVIMIMIGGFKYITSTGDSAQVNSAKNTILYAVIGLVVSVTAPFIIGFVISKI